MEVEGGGVCTCCGCGGGSGVGCGDDVPGRVGGNWTCVSF